MEGILDAIFSNIFIILALLAGLFGFFKTEEKRDENPNKPEWRDPEQQQSRQPRQQGTFQEQYETIKEDVQQTVEDIQTDASNEWYQALENTQRNLESSLEDTKRMNMSDAIKSASIVPKDRAGKPEISVRENFSRKRLVESLIMSEVLDRPKAQRRNNI